MVPAQSHQIGQHRGTAVAVVGDVMHLVDPGSTSGEAAHMIADENCAPKCRMDGPHLRHHGDELTLTIHEEWSPVAYLHALLDAEIATRGEHAVERRLRAARLPARKTLAQRW